MYPLDFTYAFYSKGLALACFSSSRGFESQSGRNCSRDCTQRRNNVVSRILRRRNDVITLVCFAGRFLPGKQAKYYINP